MTKRIIHVGSDDRFRVHVLSNAGYQVECCESLASLHAAILKVPAANLILVSENAADLSHAALALAKATSQIPVVLFQEGPERTHIASDFDLVFEAFTPPVKWLSGIEGYLHAA